jgi:hypothetical protein
VPSTHHTEEIEYGLLQNDLLPTPTLQDARIGINNIGGSQHRMERGSVALADIVLGLTNQMLPTPTLNDMTNSTIPKSQIKRNNLAGVILREVEKGLLNTPTASDKNGGCTRTNPKLQMGSSLVNQIHGITKQPIGKTSHLNPPFVLEMMGFPPDWTLLPFLNGKTNQLKPLETQ